MRFHKFLPLAALGALVIAFTPVTAQNASPEQRIGRLEKQLRQVQRVIFPKGQPADTAGFSDSPAATQDSVAGLAGRVDALERQMAEVVRASEENGNRLSVIEADLARLRAEQDARFRALQAPASESTVGAVDDAAETADTATGVADVAVSNDPIISRPKVETPKPKPVAATAPTDPAEAAYDAGFKLWTAGKYAQAITALNKMARDYPTSRRVSWAHNLAGRAQLDKGDYRDAADTLLKNYRRDPQGERAQDSVFYLGQALVKLDQASQACKAYDELETIYGSNIRPQLRGPLAEAKRAANCR